MSKYTKTAVPSCGILHVRSFPEDLKHQIKVEAAARKLTMAQFIALAVRKEIGKNA